MQAGNVSFGQVIAVSGPPKKIQNIGKKLGGCSDVMIKDATDYYRSAMPDGQLAQAARKGNKIKLYITGEEKTAVEEAKPGWKNITDILSHLQNYYDATSLSISQVVDLVTKPNKKR